MHYTIEIFLIYRIINIAKKKSFEYNLGQNLENSNKENSLSVPKRIVTAEMHHNEI